MKDVSDEFRDIAADTVDLMTTRANVPEEERDILKGYEKENKIGEVFSHMYKCKKYNESRKA